MLLFPSLFSTRWSQCNGFKKNVRRDKSLLWARHTQNTRFRKLTRPQGEEEKFKKEEEKKYCGQLDEAADQQEPLKDGQMDGGIVGGRAGREVVGGRQGGGNEGGRRGDETTPSTPPSHKYGRGIARLSQNSHKQNVHQAFTGTRHGTAEEEEEEETDGEEEV